MNKEISEHPRPVTPGVYLNGQSINFLGFRFICDIGRGLVLVFMIDGQMFERFSHDTQLLWWKDCNGKYVDSDGTLQLEEICHIKNFEPYWNLPRPT
jgi:hypothetical protein